MEARKIQQIVERDGEVTVKDLPCKRGQRVEMIVLLGSEADEGQRLPTMRDLLNSGLVGMWADRTDIADSADFARRLRERALRGAPTA
ncbi:MAG: hypothetical protein ACRD1X_19665 [Vicinamibacteria bacterium]